MPGTLTPEQSTERQAAIDSGNFMDATVSKVEQRDPRLCTVTAEDGLTFGQFVVPDEMDPPKVGDTYRLYGTTGLGGRVIGGDLRGEPCWFQTAAEVQAEEDEYRAKREADKKADYEATKDALQAQYEALDPDLKFRIDRFVANCPDNWWVQFGGYEMFALQMADAIATAAAISDDPEGAIRYFHDLPFEEQNALVPEARLSEASGNQFGYACTIALMLLSEPGVDRTLFLRWGHGALVPLVGCESYGCKPPTDEEIAEIKAMFPDPEAPIEAEVLDPKYAALRRLAHYVRENAHCVTDGDLDRFDSADVVNTHFLNILLRHDAKREDFVEVLEAVMANGGEFTDIDAQRFAQGPSYIEIGAWCGDQTLALQIMALGAFLGVWDVITPASLGVTGSVADDLAGRGFVLVSGYHPEGKISTVTIGIEREPFDSDEAHQEALRTSAEATETGRKIMESGEESAPIDITGLDPAAVLAALYNASKAIGMGVLQAREGEMTIDHAQVLLSQQNHFDYLYGRPIKMTIPTDTSEPGTVIDPRNYDRNFGTGHAASAVAALREG